MWANIKKFRKNYNHNIKINKRKWEIDYTKRLESLVDNPKQFWSHLKSLRGIEKSDTLNAISPNKWVEHFSKTFESKNIEGKNSEPMPNLDFINDNQRVLISQFTAEEISSGIKKLKNNKTSGLHSISNEMIKASAPLILPVLIIFFNKILETKEYPDNG